jgi:hypothetical protein
MHGNNLAAQLYAKAQRHPVSEWRRGTSRRYVREPVLMRRLGGTQDIHGCTVDAGPDSLGISCREALEPGDRIHVRLSLKSDEWWLFEVRHCSPSVSGFKVGLRILG